MQHVNNMDRKDWVLDPTFVTLPLFTVYRMIDYDLVIAKYYCP